MRGVFIPAALAALLAAACATGPDPSPRALNVYAAVSLREPLLRSREAMSRRAESAIVFNFGASNHLARQIISARKADLFLSADETQMDLLEREGLLEGGTRIDFLSNGLVVVVPEAAVIPIREPADLGSPSILRLSLADPAGVPAGRYAREWLRNAGLWKSLEDRVIPALDARAALAAVESGGVQAGVVYATDAALSRKVRVVYRVPREEGPEIRYAAALLAGTPSPARARTILDFLRSREAGEIFESYGFSLLGR
jgi:molybdate transport system substrate-binding protein